VCQLAFSWAAQVIQQLLGIGSRSAPGSRSISSTIGHSCSLRDDTAFTLCSPRSVARPPVYSLRHREQIVAARLGAFGFTTSWFSLIPARCAVARPGVMAAGGATSSSVQSAGGQGFLAAAAVPSTS
jgi:hypothetical protein